MAIVGMASPCYSQVSVDNETDSVVMPTLVSTVTKTTTTTTSEKKEEVEKKGFMPATSFGFNYMGRFEKAAALNMDFRFSYVNIGGGYSVSGGDGWNIYAGAAERYYFSRNFFIDAAVGPIFAHSSISYKAYVGQEAYTILGRTYYRDKYETKKESYNSFGVYLLPRLGIALGSGWGINIGYMMSAPKFKFDGFFDNGTVMLGLIFTN